MPFMTTNFRYPSDPGAVTGNCAANSNAPRPAKGLGDLSTLADDLASGNIAAVISDLLPFAAAGVLGLILFNKLSGATEKRQRSQRSAALKKLSADYDLKKKAIEAQYPTKRSKK